jgi:hypothetical protein
MQDRYGEDHAFPTQRMAHALVKVPAEDGRLLPMLDVMKDRNRTKYFGLPTPGDRWVAYTQSTSLCAYLIERYGHEKFFLVYDRPFEGIDFPGLYGKGAAALVDEWLGYVKALPADVASARALYQTMTRSRNP